MCKSEIILATNFCWNASFFLSFNLSHKMNSLKNCNIQKKFLFLFIFPQLSITIYSSLSLDSKKSSKEFFLFLTIFHQVSNIVTVPIFKSSLCMALQFVCVSGCVTRTGEGGRGPAGGCVEPQPASQPIKQDGHVTRWEGRNHRDQIWRKFATWQNFKVWQKIRNYLVFGKILSLLMKDYYAVGHNFVALNCTCWTHHLVTLDRIQSQFQ